MLKARLESLSSLMSVSLVSNAVLDPICDTLTPHGCSISADKGKIGNNSMEFVRMKFPGPDGYEASAAVYQHEVHDATGKGLCDAKQGLWDALNWEDDVVANVVQGNHCDRQYDDKNLKITLLI